ncbi:hypothetical protein [Herminiimonas contaminans]|uniref:Ubiquitin-activating enzyme E1 FCCH domain-containing protein n=1 Tax=Herminiimonas contaminans TaxID=1111140 RepID=A0ABS0ESH3_9BURK|nr:hypothetical protein [Herminiimonas contaminans]MBF8177807.1 hypothetical protein [Herminiimonas contaminans]
MTSIIQPSLTGGELAPSLYGRVDLARYGISLKTCRNFIVQQYGGVTNRAGYRFVGEVEDSDFYTRLVPFEFSTQQTYILSFGHLTLQFIKDGGFIESEPGTIYTVATPYESNDLRELSDLALLNWTQSADVLTVVHQEFQPRQISRTGHTAWTVTGFKNTNGPFRDVNVDLAKTVYSSAATGNVTLTATTALFNADLVGTDFYIEQKDYGTPWEAGKSVGANDIRRSDGKYYLAVAAGTTASLRPTHDADDWSDGGVVWRFLHPGFGVARITGFTDAQHVTATVVSRIPDGAVGAAGATYKWAFSAWGGDQGFPGAVAYFQNRQVFAGTPAQPQRNWLSRIGNYPDFGTSQPLVDDDSITFPIPGRQVNAVRHLLPLDKLAILTSGSEWIVTTGQSDVIAPATVAVKPQSYRGASWIPPLIVGNTAIYVQEKGKTIREMAFDFASDSYGGQDLTQLASHLFAKHTITEWCFQQVPHQVVWCVRSDGVLLGMTYLKEQQVVGWHRHDTDGKFESIACISEGGEDVVYAVIKRTINGVQKRYIERANTRMFNSPLDYFFVDSGLTYDGRNAQNTTMTITGGTTWKYSDDIFVVSASVDSFTADSIDTEIHFPVGTQIIRLKVIEFTDAKHVKAQANRDIPESLRDLATVTWGLARKQFSGLSHLEGKTCSVLADGNVHPQLTVSGGSVELQYAGVVVHVGLPIEAEVETLSLSVPSQETLLDKKKLINAVRMVVEDTRGLMYGEDADSLWEFMQREEENYDEPVKSATGMYEGLMSTSWSKEGTVLIRQNDPLPATILAIIPDVTVGGV